MAVGNGVALVVAGIATASLVALLRKLRGGGESTEVKCGEQVVEGGGEVKRQPKDKVAKVAPTVK